MRHAKQHASVLCWRVVRLLFLLVPTLAFGQGLEVHGENSLFAGHGVTIAWGVLRGANEEETQVILRIVPSGTTLTAIRIEGVDPFTQNRQVILDGHRLGGGLDVRTPRGTFADFPRREIRLYQNDADWEARNPAVTIFYLGLPDTTPEFVSEAALFTYLTEALAKVQGAGQERRP